VAQNKNPFPQELSISHRPSVLVHRLQNDKPNSFIRDGVPFREFIATTTQAKQTSPNKRSHIHIHIHFN